jgi:hypothetical protein
VLVNHWLERMAAEHYHSAQFVFAWSFGQSANWNTSTAEEFFLAALAWFGDPDPRIGTAWQRGERLASLVGRYRTLLVLDGLEPFQYLSGPQHGRLRESSSPCPARLHRHYRKNRAEVAALALTGQGDDGVMEYLVSYAAR